MTDQRSPDELEKRLASAFRQADLPGASPALRDALERVPDAPVTAAGSRAGRRGRGSGSGWALLGVAAVLLVGGALAFGVGGPRPSPSTDGDPTPPTAARVPAARLTYEAQWTAARPESPADIAAIETVLRRRLEALGSADHRVESLGGGRFLVELPDGADVEAIRGVLAVTGQAAFVPLGERQVFDGERIDTAGALFGSEGIADASVETDQTGRRVVTIVLAPAAAEAFRAWTAVSIGSILAITVDERVLTAPVVQAEIPGGQVQISQSGVDGWKSDEANRIAAVLSSGPYPVQLTELGGDPGPSPVATEPAGPGPTFPLVRIRGDLGCDTIMPPYRSWVFHLDPDAAEPVWAIANTGARLRVEWGSEFRGLVGPPPTVADGQSLLVVRDGTRGAMPDRGWPSLGDHFVCPGPETLYVFNEPFGG